MGDRFVLALRLRIILAHHALQFGKFADHLRQQVGLAQTRRALAFFDIGVASGAMWPASASIRAMRSACVPSFS